jgi:exopolysaccharide biosynthesis polyprenyl glycosylphosphotransferase
VGNARRHVLLNLFKLFEVAIAAASFVLAMLPERPGTDWITFAALLSMRVTVRNFALFSLFLLFWHLLFSSFGLYDSRRLSRHWAEIVDVLKATTLGVTLLAIAGRMLGIHSFTAEFLVLFWAINTASVILIRQIVRAALERIRLRGRNLRFLLIAGTNPRAIEFARNIDAHAGLGYRILGFADEDWSGAAEVEKAGYRLVCTLGSFREFLRDNVVDEVVIALPMQSRYHDASRIEALCEEQGLIIRFVSSIINPTLAHTRTEELAGDSFITFYPRTLGFWPLIAKRVLDFTVSLIGLILLAPVFAVVAILIKLSSPGPVFFTQKRLGLNKRIFSVCKFRTMVSDAEQKLAEIEHLNEVSGPVFKIKDDPRVTRVGKFLRRSSIDELPQLFNVLKGDMSLVGPRPLPVRDYRGFSHDWQRRRFCVRPGLTCLWQINGRSGIPFEEWMALDMEYIDHCSLWLDLRILIRTIPAVLKGLGAA